MFIKKCFLVQINALIPILLLGVQPQFDEAVGASK
jgi:hypothetical protein